MKDPADLPDIDGEPVYPGVYVTVEGIDGSGTTSVSEHLAEHFDAVHVAEPYEALQTGQAVRWALQADTGAFTDIHLFIADRIEHLRREVLPALERGDLVVSDRGHDSTYAYQKWRIHRHVVDPINWIDSLYSPWNVLPDMTLLLDLPAETAIERSEQNEKYEVEEFLERVRHEYIGQLTRNPDRFQRLDASKPEAQVYNDAVVEVEQLLEHRERDAR